ncbi:Zn-ribbon domain-containing OB-fold protein [Streptomyces sp. NPDC003236]|uniref:Zn-ribbon domain-containing OB-fold protein n=1 Tax=Streptomyces TaxID=1883 RepID=UPI000F013AB9|nr:OB-fold domain-containing protein [Streptomyces sp. Tu 4128]
MTDVKVQNDWPQPYRLMDAEPYWKALTDERLTFQRCTACEQAVWPAHSLCTHCGAPELSWEQSGGHGTVYSFSTIMRGPTPVWAGMSPYTVGFVQLDEGYFLFTQIEGEPEDIEIGSEVSVRFVQRGEQKLPVFARVTTDVEV